MQEIIAKMIPPTTAAGMQNVVKNVNFSFKSTPTNKASTASATLDIL